MAWIGGAAATAKQAVGAMRTAAQLLRSAGELMAAEWTREASPDRSEQVYKIIAAFDIEQFGNPGRDDWIRVQMRRALYRTVTLALAGGGVPSSRWRASSTGDGLLLLVEPTIQTAKVLRALLERLPRLLDDHNRSLAPAARLRLRVALHAAHIMLDEHGPSGEQLNLLFRILDADALRSCLARIHAPSILAVSDDIYRQVVRQRALELDPTAFQPVAVEVKETRTHAWIHADRPRPAAQPDATAIGPADQPSHAFDARPALDASPAA